MTETITATETVNPELPQDVVETPPKKTTKRKTTKKTEQQPKTERKRKTEKQTILIAFRPENYNPPRTGAGGFNGVWLQPGRNKIKRTEYDKLLSHEDFSFFLDKKTIRVISEDVPEDIESLSCIPISTSIEIIETERDLEKLQKWRKIEGQTLKRDVIINAISRQIKVIESGDL